MEAVAASASNGERDQESDELWHDLLALRKLYSLLQRTEAEDVVPHGENKDRLDEKSRNLLMKMMNGSTAESLQRQQSSVACEEKQHHPTATQQESKLLLMMCQEDGPSKEQKLQGKCHQLQTSCGVYGPATPKQWLAISPTFLSGTAAGEPRKELKRCPDCDLKRLSLGGSTRSLISPDQHKAKLCDPPPSTGGQAHRRRHPIHRDRRVNSKVRSRLRVHRDQPVKQSRQSHDQLAAATPPSDAVTKSAQQRIKAALAADRSDPRLEASGMVSCRSDRDTVHFRNDDPVGVTAPRYEAVDLTPSGSDRTGKMFQVSARTDASKQVRRNQSSSTLRRIQRSHSGMTESNHHDRRHRHQQSMQVEKGKRMKKNGEDEFVGSNRRRMQLPGALSRKTWSRSSSESRASQSSSHSMNRSPQSNSRSYSLVRVKSHRAARERSKTRKRPSHDKKAAVGWGEHSSKKPSSNSQISRRHRRSDVPPPGKLPKEQKGEQEGKLGRLKNKLSIILHHHHDHHHHLHHRSSGEDDKGVAVSAKRRHRSLWDRLSSITHRRSRTEKEKEPRRREHGHLHALLEGLIQHMFLLVKRKRRPTLQPSGRVKLGRQVGTRTVHWWQRLRRRPRFGLVGRNRKSRLRLRAGTHTK